MDMDKGVKEAKKEKEKEKKRVPFYKLFWFADSTDITLMMIGSIAAITNGVCAPLMTIIFGNVIDAFGDNQHSRHIVDVVSKVCLEYLYLAIGVGIAAFLQVSCWMVTGERQGARIRSLYLKSILRQDIAFFDKETNTGEVVERMSGDTFLIQAAMGDKVGKFLQMAAAFVTGFVIAFVQGWLLALVMMSSIPFLASAGAVMNIIISKMKTRSQTAYAKAATIVQQTTGSIRTVVSFTGEKQAIASYNKAITSAYKSGVLEGITTGIGTGAFRLVLYATYALAIWFGSIMILDRKYTGGTVINVLNSVLIGSTSLGLAFPLMGEFAAAQAAAYKMFQIINRKSDIDPCNLSGKVMDAIHGDIELRDVYFSYPTRPDEHIFSGFSLSILNGTTAALVGQSGSGKSTVISLIQRFYDPQSGQILIDGIDLKEFQLRWIRHKIGLVSQEPVLFASSIKDNIAYGKDGATIEEIKAATVLANAANFIDKFPQGLDTLVGENGAQLSGGQKQRVAIARAILKDPRILLLDEATSALDTESERIVQEALDRIMVNRTTVIVAHRLSTVRNADMIAVIHQGKVVEKGSHSQLLRNPEGAYSQLLKLQEIIRKESDEQVDEVTTQRTLSHIRSLSRRSSGRASSSRYSFSVSETREGTALPSSQEKSREVSIWRIFSLNKPEIPLLILGVLSAFIHGLLFPVISIILSRVIKIFYGPPHILRKDSKFWSLLFLVLGLVALVIQPLEFFFFSVAGNKLIQRIRSMCFERVVHMEVGWFDEPSHSSGAIGARLSTDPATVRTLVGDMLALSFQNIAAAAAGLVIAFHADWILAFIVLALIPIIILNGYVQVKFLKGFGDAKKYEEASQVANDAVASIRTVASFSAEEKVIQLYEEKCKGPVKAGAKQGLVSGVAYGLSSALFYCVSGISFYAGAVLVAQGKTTFSEVFQVILALTISAIGISQSSSYISDIGKAKTAANSVFAILDRKSKIDSNNESGMTLDKVDGELKLQHVSFSYPSRPDIQIFQDICLTIHSGKTVALVGESGSGKSTVIYLLQRFYDPNSGCITLDGTDIQKFQLKWLRQQMSLVGQEPALLNDTIRANIAYGMGGNATEAEITTAATLASAHDFICSLQQGYDTVVGERGVGLSGGQKQRVAIARAIVKNPRILLLDEATSALDAESERLVQDALDQVMVNRTTVVVAHRLSTIKNADVIAVVKDGVIAEKGNHQTLIHIKDGAYASLVELHMGRSS